MRTSLLVAVGVFLALVAAELTALLLLNHGHFVYTLDDPYIHLRLAEQIKQFHYGINAIEYSSPSSSILWPFLLAPLSSVVMFPFLLNIASAILTIVIFWKLAVRSIDIEDPGRHFLCVSAILIVLILITNLVGLVYTGMEHSLQVLLVATVAWGLVSDYGRKEVPIWVWVAIAAAPLIRYENLAISLPALAYFFFRRRYRASIAVLFVIAICMGGFSIFLMHLGLGPLPASVLAKSSMLPGASLPDVVLGNLRASVTNLRGLILCAGLLGLGTSLFFSNRAGHHRQLAVLTILAIVMHLVVGKYGWYNRYEIYIWTFMLLVTLHLSAYPLSRLFAGVEMKTFATWLFSGAAMKNPAAWLLVLGICAILAAGIQYVFHLATLPYASNNIHEQQYQMHRFIVEYYKAPVAVNDIGYVSYRNDNYVLDLYGLGSIEALKHKNDKRGTEWMNELASRNKVELAMIYRGFFSGIPNSWIKIGELHLGKRRITPASADVSFYAMNKSAYRGTVEKLHEFLRTTPADVVFVFERQGD